MSAWGKYGNNAAAIGCRTEIVDIDNGKITMRRSQDVEPVLEDVKRRQSMGALKSSGPDGGWHLAEFPMAIIERYCNDAGVTFKEWMRNPDHVKRMLRDPALSGFRVHTGNA